MNSRKFLHHFEREFLITSCAPNFPHFLFLPFWDLLPAGNEVFSAINGRQYIFFLILPPRLPTYCIHYKH